MSSEESESTEFGVVGPAKLDNSEQERTRRPPPLHSQSGHVQTAQQKEAMESAPSTLAANKLGAGQDDRGMDLKSRARHALMFVRGLYSIDGP